MADTFLRWDSMPCPWCLAPAGELCRTGKGPPTGLRATPHDSRAKAVLAAYAAQERVTR